MSHRKIIILFVMSFLLTVYPVHVLEKNAQKNNKIVFTGEFEDAKSYRAGFITLVDLHGNYYDMGRQYGVLLKTELNELYDIAIENFFIKEKKMQREKIQKIAHAVFDLYPKRYKDILYGMSKTSLLDIEKIILLNAIEWYPKIGHLSYDKCSGIAAWGPFTNNGPLLFGRNNDDDPLYKNFSRYLTVAVFNADDGSYPVANINYTGVIYCATGMNSQGLFIELNSGPWIGFSLERQTIFITILSLLQDYSDTNDIDKAFKSVLPNLNSIINVADKNKAYSYECPMFDHAIRVSGETEGLLAATNHFTDFHWDIADLEDSIGGWSFKRRDNLLKLGLKFKAKFNTKVMMQVMDTDIDHGGATVEGTIFQVIAMPSEKKIWIKMPDVQDWTEIDLGSYFKTM